MNADELRKRTQQKKINSGDLNRSIIIQTKTETHNSFGEPIYTWADSFAVWAKIVTTGGGEFYAAQKLNESTTAVFTVRFTVAIKNSNRIKHGTRIFEILSINDVDERHEKLNISTKEVV